MVLSTQELEWGRRNNMSKENKNMKQFDDSMFELVNVDETKKIHDQKFETKATTFARDAFKRFCKNKSSVVGAIIIALLMFGSFLSIFSPYDIRTANADESLLPARLFNAGTGFMDGTKHFNHIPYDEHNDCIVTGDIFDADRFSDDYVSNLTTSETVYLNNTYPYAEGGSFRLTAKKYRKEGKEYSFYLRNNTSFLITDSDNLTINITFNRADFQSAEFKGQEEENFGQYAESYRISIKEVASQIEGKTDVKYKNEYFATDWINNFADTSVNLSNCLKEHGVSKIEKAQVFIYVTPKASETMYSYVLIDNVTLTSTDATTQALLDQINITDVNTTASYGKDKLGYVPVGYWATTANPYVWRVHYRYVSFTLDIYAYLFGDRRNFEIGGTIMKQYVAKGWCEFPNFEDITTFKVLDADKCPVKEVTGVTIDKDFGTYNFKTTTTYYKYKGYGSIPRYIFGTDGNGHDLLTVAFSSLKNSLLVAVIASSICLAIGLVWGSISGYYGGNVDIIMERITDILGGVPWIVMMTLIILLMGNNIVTFAFALIMTGWIGTSARTRTQFYRFKRREYILASRTLGASDARLIFRHILPNGLGTIVTGTVLMIPGCIFSEATISYLGLGLQGVDSFGVLLSNNQQYIQTFPFLIIVPAAIISLLMISFNLFGNGLRDAINPTLKGGEQ